MTHQAEIAPPTETISDGERERRQRVLKKGIVSYNGGSITLEVMVRDFSTKGVKIKQLVDVPIPDHFTLDIPMDGVRMECQVRWRDGDTLGVLFLSEPETRGEAHRFSLQESYRPGPTLRKKAV